MDVIKPLVRAKQDDDDDGIFLFFLYQCVCVRTLLCFLNDALNWLLLVR